MTRRQLLLASIVALASVNIAALAFAGFWGLFALGASYPLAKKILNKIDEIDRFETLDTLDNLIKSIEAGSGQSSLNQGAALQVEDLSAILSACRLCRFDSKDLKPWNNLKKT